MGRLHEEGVTLIEMLAALMVLAILIAAGIPAMGEFIANNRMAAAVNDVVASLNLARSEAVKRRANVTICASSDGAGCSGAATAGDGWIVFRDCSAGEPGSPAGCGAPDGLVDGPAQIIQRHGPLHDDIGANSTIGDQNGNPAGQFLVSFGADGYTRDIDGMLCADGNACVTNLQFCDRRGSDPTFGERASGRWVQIAATGRPRIYSRHDLVQSASNPLAGCPAPE